MRGTDCIIKQAFTQHHLGSIQLSIDVVGAILIATSKSECVVGLNAPSKCAHVRKCENQVFALVLLPHLINVRLQVRAICLTSSETVMSWSHNALIRT